MHVLRGCSLLPSCADAHQWRCHRLPLGQYLRISLRTSPPCHHRHHFHPLNAHGSLATAASRTRLSVPMAASATYGLVARAAATASMAARRAARAPTPSCAPLKGEHAFTSPVNLLDSALARARQTTPCQKKAASHRRRRLRRLQLRPAHHRRCLRRRRHPRHRDLHPHRRMCDSSTRRSCYALL